MAHYDLVLVLDYFRSASAYLSIIRYLAPYARIGLYVTPLDEKLKKKNEAAHAQFIDECIRLGATLCEDRSIATNVLLVQQRPYADETVSAIKHQIEWRVCIGYLGLTLAGLAQHDRFLQQFGIRRVYVPNRRLFEFLLDRRGRRDVYREVETVQVGLPFAKYPVHNGFEADYLIAAPTSFSFRSEEQKHRFLETVLQLLEQIGGSARVVYKPHNGAYRDYFAPRGYSGLGRVLARVPGSREWWSFMTQQTPKAVRKPFERVYSALLHALILDRVVPLGEVVRCPEFSLEVFLPGVKRGVIGGLSNTIWGTLFFGLCFYNCVDVARWKEEPAMPNKNPSQLLELNLAFFEVPYCEGRLDANGFGADIVRDEDKEGDLIERLQADLGLTVRKGSPRERGPISGKVIRS